MKYILISGDKGRYDRAIELCIVGIYDTLQEASDYLIEHYIYRDEKIMQAIKDYQKYVEIHYDSYYLNYTDNLLTYYSTGCPIDNEYGGETYQIFSLERE